MRKNPVGEHSVSPLRMFLVFVRCSASVVFALLGLASSKPAMQSGPKLAVLKLNLERQLLAKQGHSANHQNLLPSSNINAALPPDAPTFGHPVIAGIGGTGFEESIRVYRPSGVVVSVPGGGVNSNVDAGIGVRV